MKPLSATTLLCALAYTAGAQTTASPALCVGYPDIHACYERAALDHLERNPEPPQRDDHPPYPGETCVVNGIAGLTATKNAECILPSDPRYAGMIPPEGRVSSPQNPSPLTGGLDPALICADCQGTVRITPLAPHVDPPASVSAPSYSSTTGARFDYYSRTLTETTNLGIHVTGSSQSQDTPAGLWAIVSVDATPRSQNSSAALRVGGKYFLKSAAAGNLIVYANIAAGATTTTTAAIGAASSGAVSSSLLGNLNGGMGFVWRACHTFDRFAKVNCIVDLDYELTAVSSQAVKPVVGLYVGLVF